MLLWKIKYLVGSKEVNCKVTGNSIKDCRKLIEEVENTSVIILEYK